MLAFRPTVMKFGGTSVGDTAAFQRVASIIAARLESRPVVVVSAMSGMTDALLCSVGRSAAGYPKESLDSLQPHFARHLAVAEQLLTTEQVETFGVQVDRVRAEISALLDSVAEHKEQRATLQDAVLAFGEQLSSALLTATLCAFGVNAVTVDARSCIVTSNEHGEASPLTSVAASQTRATLSPLFQRAQVPVLGGFIGATAEGITTTLGRGGSDYTAAIVGAAISAGEIQIWTDVTGVLTADPRVVPDAVTIPRLSYAEAAELAYFGAKVLHPKTIQPAVEGEIPVRICNSRESEAAGTLVCSETETAARTVKAIAHKTGITTIQVSSARMLGAYGFLRAIFEVFDRHRTVVDVVTTSEVSVSLSLDDTTNLEPIVVELERLGSVAVETDRAMICVVGAGLRGTPGIAASVFNTISDINVMLISQGSSSINLTFVIEERQMNEAVSRLHRTFFEADIRSRVDVVRRIKATS